MKTTGILAIAVALGTWIQEADSFAHSRLGSTAIQLLSSYRREEYEEDERFYDDPPSRSRSPEEQELRDRVRYKIDAGTSYYPDINQPAKDNELQRQPQNDEYLSYEDDVVYENDIEYEDDGYDDYDGYYEDEQDEGYDTADPQQVPTNGNFWSNPSQSIPRRPRRPPSTAAPHRRPSRTRGARTTFRSGTPAPPDAISDFYDRLFWYGVDDDEEGEVLPASYDKTVFGGTRGKFNALAFLQDDNDSRRPPPRRIKRIGADDQPPPRRPDDDDDYYYDDGDDLDDDDYYYDEEPTPPPRRRRRSSGSSSRGQDDRMGTSGWFTEQDEEMFDSEEDEEEYRYNNPRNRRRRSADSPITSNPVVRFLDDVFKVDREELDSKARMYDQNLGMEGRSQRNDRSRSSSSSSSRYRRPNDDFGQDESYEDYEQVIELKSDTHEVVVDVQVEDTISKQDEDVETTGPRLSWEERASRLERVPPAGVPAWGPSGDLGIDARTKAMLDAMDDLRQAKDKVAIKTERVSLAREEIVVLRTDYELENKRATGDPRRSRTRLRQLQLDVEDGARNLRRAQKQEQDAKRQLEDLRDKYWAVLSLYDAEKASHEVNEAFVELGMSEVATGEGESSSGVVDANVDASDSEN